MIRPDPREPQGRQVRPWEPWWLTLTYGPALVGLLGLAGVLSLGFHLTFGVVVLIISAGAWFALRLFDDSVGLSIRVWRQLDRSLSRVDRHWSPKRPSVRTTDRGLIVMVSPAPAIPDEQLQRLLDGAAQTFGLRCLHFSTTMQGGFGARAHLRIEMGR